MKRVAFAVVGLLSVSEAALAQEPERPGPLVHRFDEDWRPWCAAGEPRTATETIKCLSPAPDLNLSLGGELRERFEAARNPGFGLRQNSESALLHRAMLHADLRAGQHVRAFVQFGWFDQSGRDVRPAPTDIDRLDVTQAFVDLSASAGGGRATLRAGRQELSFGSQRLIAVREGPNIRRSYDGVRAFWNRGATRADAFYIEPVEIRPGSFDDRTQPGEALWGVYATSPIPSIKGLSADLYYLGYRRDDAGFSIGRADERRHTLGARLFGATDGFDWDIEAAVQSGNFGASSIRAWTVATDIGYTFSSAPLAPRFGLKADIASGDRDPGDNRLGTFNALYPKLPYFSEAGLVAPANIMDVQPSVALALSSTLRAQVGWNGLWRHTTRDAVYTAPLVAVPGTAGRPGRFIGHQAIFGLEWQARRDFSVSAEYVHFRPGKGLRAAGGEEVDFLKLSASYKF